MGSTGFAEAYWTLNPKPYTLNPKPETQRWGSHVSETGDRVAGGVDLGKNAALHPISEAQILIPVPLGRKRILFVI